MSGVKIKKARLTIERLNDKRNCLFLTFKSLGWAANLREYWRYNKYF